MQDVDRTPGNSNKGGKDLFNKCWQKGRAVRLLGVRFSQFIPMTMQMSLFENNLEKLNLYKAVDEIKDRFGAQLVKKAVNSDSKEGSSFDTTRHNKKKNAE